MFKPFTSMLAAVTLSLGLSAATYASPSDHLTKFTFDRPVSLPGVTLPAGTYQFKLADSSERKVVQVLDENGTHSYALLQSVPSDRQEIGDSQLMFMRTVSGMPAAVKMWYPEGQSTGFEFIYPEDQMAKLTGTESEPSFVTRRTESVEARSDADAPKLQASAQSATQSTPAPQQTTAPPADVNSNATRDALPRTASSVPLVALFGALALFGGAWMLGRTHA